MAPPPPPPPPPLCLPFGNSKKKERRLSPSRTFSEKGSYLPSRESLPRRDSYDSQGTRRSFTPPPMHQRAHSMQRSFSNGSNGSYSSNQLPRNDPYTSSDTVTSLSKVTQDKLTFKTDSESYNVPSRPSTPPPPQPKKLGWGFGWGLGKKRQVEKGFTPDKGLVERKRSLLKRNNSVSSQATVTNTNETPYTTRSINTSQFSIVSPGPGPVLPVRPPLSTIADESPRSALQSPRRDLSRSNTQNSKSSGRSGGSGKSGGGGIIGRFSPKRPQLSPADSQDTLVGSALERKLSDFEPLKERIDTTTRLQELRTLMAKDNLDY